MWLLMLLACGAEIASVEEPAQAPAPMEVVAQTPRKQLNPLAARTATASEGADEVLEAASKPGEPVITVPVEPNRPSLRSPATAKSAGPPKHLREAVASSPHHAAGE